MLAVEDWAEIRRLHRAEGLAIKAISRRLGVSRNAVRRALAAAEPPRYSRPVRVSAVDAFEPAIRELLREFPAMPASVIAERVGWVRSGSVLRARVAALRPLFAPPDPASRTGYDPGGLAQCDLWFPPVDVPLGFGQSGRPPVLVMVAGHSRVMTALMLPSRQGPDLIAGHWQLLQGWGAVPRALVWDNESAVGSWRAGRPKLTDQFEAFRGMLGIRVIQCRPRDPESKGLVERANGYLETSFLPGRAFASPADFNSQLQDWLARANSRQHRALGCRPIDRWAADRQAMLALPPVAPAMGWREAVRLPRDYYVRLDSNDYSVYPAAIGRRVEVRADSQTVTVTCGGRVVAAHDRCWARPRASPIPRTAPRPTRCAPRRGPDPPIPARSATLVSRLRPDLRARRGRRLMAAAKAGDVARTRDTAAEIAFLTRALKAPTMRDAVARLAERARAESWSHEEFLVACLQREVSARESHGGEGRIRAARLPARKSLEDFDFDHARGLRRDLVAHLGTLDFVAAKDNVVFLGPPGTGKTHLATGLAIRACQAGHRVLFATASQWVDRLAAAHRDGNLQAELIRLGRYPLLVIDEVGYIPFESEAANLFFQLVSSRYERASLIVTSNKPFGRWGEVFGDDTVAAAMIDRLVHHAEVIALKGDSYRLKDRDLGRSAAGAADQD